MKAVRFLAGLVAVLLVVVGIAVAVVIGPDDTWGGEPAAVPDGESVVTTSPDLLDVAGFELVVTAAAGEGDVFIGAGHPVHVENYVTDVARTRVTGLAPDGIGDSSAAKGERAYPSTPPSELSVWTEQVTGPGEQQVAVPLTEDAAVQVAVLPATAKGEAPQVGFGYALPGIFVVGLVIALVGLLLLAGVIVLGRRSRRGQRVPVGVSSAESVPEPDEGPTSRQPGSTMAQRVVTIGAVGVLVAGCSVPRPVEHGETPGVVPLEQEDAQAMLDDYDERNNAAIKKSHSGDASGWKLADTGPLLSIDETAAKLNAVDQPKGAPNSFDHQAGEVFESSQEAYPLSTALATTDEGSTEDGVGLDVFEKESAAAPWKGRSGVWIPSKKDLPTALSAEEATPSAEDLERAGEVDALLERWIEKGKAPGLSVPKELKDVRAELSESEKGIDRIAQSSGPWGGDEDRTAPGGSVRTIRVEEGLLVLTDQEWDCRAYLESGYEWKRPTKETKVYGEQHQSNVDKTSVALSAAILVPDSGDAEILGASTRRVIDFPR